MNDEVKRPDDFGQPDFQFWNEPNIPRLTRVARLLLVLRKCGLGMIIVLAVLGTVCLLAYLCTLVERTETVIALLCLGALAVVFGIVAFMKDTSDATYPSAVRDGEDDT